MSKEDFQLTTITRVFDDDSRLVEAPGFPEISALGDVDERAVVTLRTKAVALLEDADMVPAITVFRRRFGAAAELDHIELPIDPPRRRPDWESPVTIRLPLVRWCEQELHHAWIPALGVLVFASRADLLPARLREHARLVLAARHQRLQLFDLVHLARERAVQPGRVELTVTRKTPRQLAEAGNQAVAEESILARVAEELPPRISVAARPAAKIPPPVVFEVEAELPQLAAALGGARARSVLLIGPPGCGKTALVGELARRRGDFGFAQTPFWSTSGARLMTGPIGFGLWQERCQGLCREAARTRAIVHLGNLVELLEVGKASRGEQSVGGYLRPWLARGELLAIAECTPEQLGFIERIEPHLAGAFHRIEVPPRSAAQTRSILSQVYDEGAARKGGQASAGRRRELVREGFGAGMNGAAQRTVNVALDRLSQLHLRYATYSANPGRPVQFLRRLLADGSAEALDEARVIAAFSRETGLPELLLDDRVPLALESARDWFGERVAGQSAAIDHVLDLLALIKSRLARPHKPLASLLFIGPTGTGKTELAKVLAAYLFGDSARLSRFDLNQFNDPVSVQRLIGGSGVGDAEGLLTARVREQPFSVLLFDEFEKADAAFFDLLLQVLGDGRLTDAAGRVADFCNCVIVMTSNLGAEGFQRGPSGFYAGTGSHRDALDHFTAAVRQFLRPEIYNRLDAVVPFAPLSRDIVHAIARREITRVLDRDGLHLRPVRVHLDPAVVAHLADRGHDPRYGARPLKRLIESSLAVPLADALALHPATVPVDLHVALHAGAVRVSAKAKQDQAADAANSAQRALAALVELIVKLRRRITRLTRCPAVNDLESRITMLTAIERRLLRAEKKPVAGDPRLAGLPGLRTCQQSVEALARQVRDLEDDARAAWHQRDVATHAGQAARFETLRMECRRIQREVFRRHQVNPDDVVLAFYADHGATLFQFAAAYRALAAQLGRVDRVEVILQPPGGRSKSVRWLREVVAKPADFFAKPPGGVIGVILHVSGDLLYPRLVGEAGLHELREKDSRQQCLVETGPAAAAYEPPAGIELKGGVAARGAGMQRTFDREENAVIDGELGRRPWLVPAMEPCLESLTEERLNQAIEEATG